MYNKLSSSNEIFALLPCCRNFLRMGNIWTAEHKLGKIFREPLTNWICEMRIKWWHLNHSLILHSSRFPQTMCGFFTTVRKVLLFLLFLWKVSPNHFWDQCFTLHFVCGECGPLHYSAARDLTISDCFWVVTQTWRIGESSRGEGGVGEGRRGKLNKCPTSFHLFGFTFKLGNVQVSKCFNKRERKIVLERQFQTEHK